MSQHKPKPGRAALVYRSIEEELPPTASQEARLVKHFDDSADDLGQELELDLEIQEEAWSAGPSQEQIQAVDKLYSELFPESASSMSLPAAGRASTSGLAPVARPTPAARPAPAGSLMHSSAYDFPAESLRPGPDYESPPSQGFLPRSQGHVTAPPEEYVTPSSWDLPDVVLPPRRTKARPEAEPGLASELLSDVLSQELRAVPSPGVKLPNPLPVREPSREPSGAGVIPELQHETTAGDLARLTRSFHSLSGVRGPQAGTHSQTQLPAARRTTSGPRRVATRPQRAPAQAPATKEPKRRVDPLLKELAGMQHAPSSASWQELTALGHERRQQADERERQARLFRSGLIALVVSAIFFAAMLGVWFLRLQ